MTEEKGRGAWPSAGTGGTLALSKDKKKTIPGKYYMLAKDPGQTVGLRKVLHEAAHQPPPLEDLAVWHGVVGIQVLLAGFLGENVPVTGLFDQSTDWALKKAQTQLGLTADGIVGPATMKALLLPLIKRTAKELLGQDWKPIYGILANEGAFDPGAVGFLDPGDLGLAQINMLSHPDVTISNAFCPSFAVKFVAKLLAQGLDVFHDQRLAVASYNLGVGGTRQWIAAGQPSVWQPPWADKERSVKTYIDRILGQADKDGVK